jgi:hypothetical protein
MNFWLLVLKEREQWNFILQEALIDTLSDKTLGHNIYYIAVDRYTRPSKKLTKLG